jgi:predicted MFS family arabinose efflux permease
MSTAFGSLLFAYILSQFYRAFLAVIAVDLARDLSLDAAGLGNLSAIWFAAFAFAQFPVGLALDRFGPRRTMAGFYLVAVAGAASFALAESFTSAAIAMALIGVGCAPILMGSYYYFGRTAPPERFALLASLLVGLGSLGNLLGAAPLAWSASAIGWRASMLVIAAATAVSVLGVMVFIKDPPRIESKTTQREGFLSGFVAIFSLRPIRFMAALILVSYGAVAGLRSLWIAPFFGQVHGFDVSERGHAALLMAAAMSLGALMYGPLERRLGGPKPTVIAGTLAAIASLAALALFGAQSTFAALAAYALFGLTAMTYAILMAHARMFFPAHLLGRGVTALNFLFIGGAGLLQWGSGHLVQATSAAGWTPASTYAALHGGVGLLLAVALVPYLISPARPEKI